MRADEPTVAALLTPAGRGAVATIGIRGPRAAALLTKFFVPHGVRPLSEAALGEVRVGRWKDSAGEEVVVSSVRTGEWEIHCHGGSAAAAAILADLAGSGCGTIDWRTWVADEASDLIVCEARLALAEATTERAAGVLVDQLDGALRRALETIDASLADERVETASLDAAAEGLRHLLEMAPLGLHLVKPWRVVVTGLPNVGKSSLVNALVGYERSIVYDLPGTTRDAVSVSTAIDGWPVLLFDTAGLRETTDAIEAAGVDRAKARIAEADLVLLVEQANEPASSDDAAHLAELSQVQVLRVLSKCDLVSDESCAKDVRDGSVIHATSAKTREGIAALLDAIAARLVPAPPKPRAAVPFTERQIAAIEAALLAVNERDRASVRRAIAEAISSRGD